MDEAAASERFVTAVSIGSALRRCRATRMLGAPGVVEPVLDADVEARHQRLRNRLETAGQRGRRPNALHRGVAIDGERHRLEFTTATGVSTDLHRDPEVGVALQESVGYVTQRSMAPDGSAGHRSMVSPPMAATNWPPTEEGSGV